jgi:hypothetical protein
MGASDNFNNAFDTALLRAEETGLGILVYSLVSILIWPNDSRDSFDAAVKKLATTQHQMYQHCFGLMCGQPDAIKVQALKTQIVQQQTQFNQLLDAAETDSYDVWELRQQWRQYQQQMVQLTGAMDHWCESFVDLNGLDLQHLLPNLTAFGEELDDRLKKVASMLADQTPGKQPSVINIELDDSNVHTLSHFHKAALAVTRGQLQHIEQLTRSLFYTISDIKHFNHSVEIADTNQSPHPFFVLDPDRIANVVQIMVIMWLSYLAVIYIDGIPGGATLVTVSTVFGMIMATIPQASFTLLIAPITASIFIATLIYIFVLPQLSSFFGLGLLIFAVTFIFCYMFAKPQQALGRAFGLAMFVMISSISNEQTYNFLVPANTAMMFPFVFLILAITAYIPFSPHPEHAFLRLRNRFFRHCEFIISSLTEDRQQSVTGMNHWIRYSRTQDFASLPKKLGIFGKHIDINRLPGTKIDQVQSIVSTLQILVFRIQDLLEVRSRHQADSLLNPLKDDAAAWRNKLVKTLQQLSKDPSFGKGELLRSGLDELMVNMEKRIKETLDQTDEGQLTATESENFYGLLGAYRSVSEALVDYAEKAEVIDWDYWREGRFA